MSVPLRMPVLNRLLIPMRGNETEGDAEDAGITLVTDPHEG